MSKSRPTHYEILGVKPNAKHNDIGLAYNRLMAARRRENAPPDLKGETALGEAFAVLSDLDRRAAYDQQLAGARLKPAFGARQGAFAAVVIALFAGAIYYYTIMRPAEEAARPVGRLPADIAAAATPAMGRLQATDMSGQTKPAGLAFAIEGGVMVASCREIAPNAQLVVNMNPRMVPARLTMTDEALGLCKLEVDGAGSWPLPVSSVETRTGDTVYAASVNARGEVVLKEGRVKRVSSMAKGQVVEASVLANAADAGAPLLDIYGRVVAVATQAEGKERHVVLPKAWTDAPRPAPAPTTPLSPEATPGSERPAPPMPNGPGSMTPERVDRLDKAFHPPPNVPDDL
jgi:hypothetical protein